MKSRHAHEIGNRTSRASAETSAQPWKSGASAPRRNALVHEGFSPRGPQGLKAILQPVRNAALKGPLFHGIARVPARLLAAFFLTAFFATHALAQVTFDRLLNSAKEPQNWMTY